MDVKEFQFAQLMSAELLCKLSLFNPTTSWDQSAAYTAVLMLMLLNYFRKNIGWDLSPGMLQAIEFF